MARPDPAQLAIRLYERELAGRNLEAFSGAVAAYAEALGEPGLAAYRALAERDWSGFTDYVAGVRRRHKPKRNPIKLLDSRWPATT